MHSSTASVREEMDNDIESSSEMGDFVSGIEASQDSIPKIEDVEEATDNSDGDEILSEDEEEESSNKSTKGKPKVPNKKQEVGKTLGKGFDQYTIKVPLENYMKKNINPTVVNVC